jgi:hypothetical protein
VHWVTYRTQTLNAPIVRRVTYIRLQNLNLTPNHQLQPIDTAEHCVIFEGVTAMLKFFVFVGVVTTGVGIGAAAGGSGGGVVGGIGGAIVGAFLLGRLA